MVRATGQRVRAALVVAAIGVLVAVACALGAPLVRAPWASALGCAGIWFAAGIAGAVVSRGPAVPWAVLSTGGLAAGLFCLEAVAPGAGVIAAGSWAGAAAFGVWRGPVPVAPAPDEDEDTAVPFSAPRLSWLVFGFPVAASAAFAYVSPDANVTGSVWGSAVGAVLVAQHVAAQSAIPFAFRPPSLAQAIYLSAAGLWVALVRFVRDETIVVAQEEL